MGSKTLGRGSVAVESILRIVLNVSAFSLEAKLVSRVPVSSRLKHFMLKSNFDIEPRFCKSLQALTSLETIYITNDLQADDLRADLTCTTTGHCAQLLSRISEERAQ